MIGLSLSITPSELGVALGIAFTDRLGAVTNAIIANPIKTMRLTGCPPYSSMRVQLKRLHVYFSLPARRHRKNGIEAGRSGFLLSPERELERPPAVPLMERTRLDCASAPHQFLGYGGVYPGPAGDQKECDGPLDMSPDLRPHFPQLRESARMSTATQPA
jgi:hypothetical protein